MAYGLLIDTEFCTGCHSCEVACQVEHGLPADKFGIKLAKLGLWEIDGKWQDSYVPCPTDACDTCAHRRSLGKLPSCAHHCQAQVITFGPIEELAKELEAKPKQVLFRIS